jgi:hypothetical protein
VDGLQKLLQSGSCEFDITKNACQKARPQRFIGMNGHNGRSSVWVPQKMVTTLHPDFLKANVFQHCDESLS